jgi:hypothetical protein
VKAEEEKKDSPKEASQASTTAEPKDTKAPSKSSSTNPEHDLDVFLLGDLGSDDEGPGMLLTSLDLEFLSLLQFLYMTFFCSILLSVDGDDGLDDDFDRIDATTVRTDVLLRNYCIHYLLPRCSCILHLTKRSYHIECGV